jgi:hypothetical protein
MLRSYSDGSLAYFRTRAPRAVWAGAPFWEVPLSLGKLAFLFSTCSLAGFPFFPLVTQIVFNHLEISLAEPGK